jgi:alkylation response protein AidB-like acyl-CoA dehydrogenase
MDFVFNEEQQELRSAARSFLEDHSGSDQVRSAMESELGFDPKIWAQIGTELGWTSVSIPEEYGGLGLGYVELVALLEVMGESLLCSPFFSSICLAANAILVAGTEGQKAELLPGLAEGVQTGTLAYTEANGRWDLDAIATSATREGNDFILSGHKRFVLDGHSADLLVVAARRTGSEGSEGISLFALPAETAGITRKLLPTMDQTRRQAEIILDNVRIPASCLLGEEGNSGPALEKALCLAGVALAAEQVGGAQRCLDLAVDYAKERVQFGRPIGSFQAIKHKCADMMIKVESARSAAYYAGCIAAEGGEELAAVASTTQAAASDAYFDCAGDSLQIHGGVGFTWEYDVHLYFKRARSSAVFLGDGAYHREKVARLLGLGVPV